jgi:hypothetical protein
MGSGEFLWSAPPHLSHAATQRFLVQTAAESIELPIQEMHGRLLASHPSARSWMDVVGPQAVPGRRSLG